MKGGRDQPLLQHQLNAYGECRHALSCDAGTQTIAVKAASPCCCRPGRMTQPQPVAGCGCRSAQQRAAAPAAPTEACRAANKCRSSSWQVTARARQHANVYMRAVMLSHRVTSWETGEILDQRGIFGAMTARRPLQCGWQSQRSAPACWAFADVACSRCSSSERRRSTFSTAGFAASGVCHKPHSWMAIGRFQPCLPPDSADQRHVSVTDTAGRRRWPRAVVPHARIEEA